MIVTVRMLISSTIIMILKIEILAKQQQLKNDYNNDDKDNDYNDANNGDYAMTRNPY